LKKKMKEKNIKYINQHINPIFEPLIIELLKKKP